MFPISHDYIHETKTKRYDVIAVNFFLQQRNKIPPQKMANSMRLMLLQNLLFT